MTRVCAITLTDVRNDLRIRKEAAAVAQSYPTTVVSMIEGVEEPFELDGFEVVPLRLRSRKLPKSPIFWVVKYLEFVLRASLAASRRRAGLYHGHEITGAIPAWLAARRRGARFVYDAHELEADRGTVAETIGWVNRPLVGAVRALLRRADAVICANESRADIMMADYGVRQRPTPILNVAPLGGLPEGDAPDALPACYGRDRIVLYQGALSASRGLEHLVAAVPAMPQDVALVIVGGGGVQASLGAQAEQLGIAHRVFLTGRVPADRLVHYMRGATLGVAIYQNTCRNNYYCAPNKVHEYASVGIPFVGPDFPEVSTLVDRFSVGAVFDPASAESIAEAVHHVLDDPQRYAAMARATTELRQAMNWGQEAVKLRALYRNVLERGRDYATAPVAGGVDGVRVNVDG